MLNRRVLAFSMGALAALAASGAAFGQFPQGFDGAAGLPVGWVSVNNSPSGPGINPDWQQEDAAGLPFLAHGGTGYAWANYQSVTGTNTISNYLMSPEVTLENGAIIRFWTRCPDGSIWPDRLILTYSTNGASTDPADYANLANLNFQVLASVNPTLVQGGYPVVWTQFVSTPISGLAGPTQGRFAFWYHVTNGGPTGANSNFIGVDDVEFIPPGVTTGACCAGDGTCSSTTPEACNAPGSTFFGIASDCGAVSCIGRCCQADGFCNNLAPAACVGAGFTFGGLGTACNFQNPVECTGRCCPPDGVCFETGPEPCAAVGGVFGGVGATCGGNQCKGRCCLVDGTCVPNSTPASCSTAGGVYTASLDCSVYTVSTFTSGGAAGSTGPLPLSIPDPPATGVVNIQTVSGVVGTIADLNVDVKVDHTYTGDVEVRLEFNSVTAILISQLGTPLGGFGCSTANFDVSLDDEATAGSIDNQCNLTAPAAVSPPSYVPTMLLSDFDGMNPNGDWTIHVTDFASPDTGSLIRWSLHIGTLAGPNVVCAPACTCKGDLNGSGTVNGADIIKFAQCVAAPATPGCECADINGGGIDATDVAPFVTGLLAGTACIP